MKMENMDNSDVMEIYTVQILAKQQNTPEVKEANMKEVENLMKYDVFEKVDNYGKEYILGYIFYRIHY